LHLCKHVSLYFTNFNFTWHPAKKTAILEKVVAILRNGKLKKGEKYIPV